MTTTTCGQCERPIDPDARRCHDGTYLCVRCRDMTACTCSARYIAPETDPLCPIDGSDAARRGFEAAMNAIWESTADVFPEAEQFAQVLLAIGVEMMANAGHVLGSGVEILAQSTDAVAWRIVQMNADEVRVEELRRA